MEQRSESDLAVRSKVRIRTCNRLIRRLLQPAEQLRGFLPGRSAFERHRQRDHAVARPALSRLQRPGGPGGGAERTCDRLESRRRRARHSRCGCWPVAASDGLPLGVVGAPGGPRESTLLLLTAWAGRLARSGVDQRLGPRCLFVASGASSFGPWSARARAAFRAPVPPLVLSGGVSQGKLRVLRASPRYACDRFMICSRRFLCQSMISTWIPPAIGIAISAPSTPATSAPTRTATSTASGESCTVRP